MSIGRLDGVWVWPSPDVNDTPCRLTEKYWTFVHDRGQCPWQELPYDYRMLCGRTGDTRLADAFRV